jgi:putative oxidoreductase
MVFIRAFARPMLASTFVMGGIDTLLHSRSRVAAADPIVSGLAQRLPKNIDTKRIVQGDAAVKVVAGSMLAMGKFPRLSAAALAASLVPTSLAGHPFWAETDPAKRTQQRLHFAKNVSMLGGLLIAAVDTQGKPSLAWRARRTPDAIKHAAVGVVREAGLAARSAGGTVRETLPV